MDSKPKYSNFGSLCLALSALLFFLGTGLTPLWPSTWMAAIPVLWVSPRVSGKEAFFLGAAAYALGGLNVWSYSVQVIPIWLVASLLLLGGCLFGLGVLLFRGRILRGRMWQAVLVLPAFWVTVDYLISVVSIHGTFGNISYSQMNFLPIVQIASATGIWGISFCMFLFAATVAALFGEGPVSAKIGAAVGTSLLLACVFGYGSWRLAATPKDSPTVKVALMGSSANGNFFARTPGEFKPILERYEEQIKGVASEGVQLIVIPEHVGPVTDASEADADTQLGRIAKETGAYVAIGIERISPHVSWNQVRLYSPHGDLAATYNKHHMLPPFESHFRIGTKRTVLNESSGKWGIEICKDMDFPRLSREYSQDGIGMLIVSASDFVADGWLHGRMAVLRGVESGFSIARAADLGILTASDDRGRILAEQSTVGIGAPIATAVAEVPVRHDGTLYSRFGDWFAWVCMALFLWTWLSARRADSRQLTTENTSEPVAV